MTGDEIRLDLLETGEEEDTLSVDQHGDWMPWETTRRPGNATSKDGKPVDRQVRDQK